jgi:hypothetical protein
MKRRQATATGVLAWHFLPEDRRLRWGSREIVEVGRTLEMKGKPEMCNRGFHASRRIIDALKYATGPILCRVEVGGTILEDDDKLVGTTRRVVAMADASPMLHLFACDLAEAVLKAAGVTDSRALGVIQAKRLWVAGDTTDAEMAAALAAACDAACDEACDAACDEACDESCDEAWDAAWAAACDEALDAARDAARDAAWGAARDAECDAECDEAWDASCDEALGAARAAARAAARGAARDAHNTDLTHRALDLLGIKEADR